jgi:hypothetical protein
VIVRRAILDGLHDEQFQGARRERSPPETRTIVDVLHKQRS